MLTVRDHILQGNYPTTDRGWSPVPTRNGRTARIITAHGEEPTPLIGLGSGGIPMCWRVDGRLFALEDHALDLMPPLVRLATAADLGIAA